MNINHERKQSRNQKEIGRNLFPVPRQICESSSQVESVKEACRTPQPTHLSTQLLRRNTI
jgi:hypothetical protein